MEGWRGERAFVAEQKKVIAEYESITPVPLLLVPDDQNFFAAPVFDGFCRPSSQLKGVVAAEFAARFPHSKYVSMHYPVMKLTQREVPTVDGKPDAAQWAAAEIKAGGVRPAGMSDAGWLHASLLPDKTVEGMVAALCRKEAVMLPLHEDNLAMGRALGQGIHGCVPEVKDGLFFLRALGQRALIAAEAGRGREARELVEVMSRFARGGERGGYLVWALMGVAFADTAVGTLEAGLRTRCWGEGDLAVLAECFARVDEERMVLRALQYEAFYYLSFPREEVVAAMQSANMMGAGSGGKGAWRWGSPRQMWSRLCVHTAMSGGEGILLGNFATLGGWWRLVMGPDGPGDDLAKMVPKFSAGMRHVESEMEEWGSPQKVMASMAMPAMGNVLEGTLEAQVRRRLALGAIAVERFILQHGARPELRRGLPLDPWKPGTEVSYEAGPGGTGEYEIKAGDGKKIWKVGR